MRVCVCVCVCSAGAVPGVAPWPALCGNAPIIGGLNNVPSTSAVGGISYATISGFYASGYLVFRSYGELVFRLPGVHVCYLVFMYATWCSGLTVSFGTHTLLCLIYLSSAAVVV